MMMTGLARVFDKNDWTYRIVKNVKVEPLAERLLDPILPITAIVVLLLLLLLVVLEEC